jgi:hypothetical protein
MFSENAQLYSLIQVVEKNVFLCDLFLVVACKFTVNQDKGKAHFVGNVAKKRRLKAAFFRNDDFQQSGAGGSIVVIASSNNDTSNHSSSCNNRNNHTGTTAELVFFLRGRTSALDRGFRRGFGSGSCISYNRSADERRSCQSSERDFTETHFFDSFL